MPALPAGNAARDGPAPGNATSILLGDVCLFLFNELPVVVVPP